MKPTSSSAPKAPSKMYTEYYGTVFFALIAAFIGVAGFVLKPMLDDIKQTNAQTTASIQTLDGERRYLASLEQSIAAAKAISPDILKRVDRAMPRGSELPELLVTFSSLAERDNVRIANVAFAEPSGSALKNAGAIRAATSTQLQATLSVSAKGYPDIKRFIQDIERSLRLMDVVGMTASSRDGQASYVIQVNTYAYSMPRP